MMALLAGEPSGKAGSLCKRLLRALIWLFTSVCKIWVRIRPPDGATTRAATVPRSTVRVAHQEAARGTAASPGSAQRPPRPEECSLARRVPAGHASGEGHRTVPAGAPPRRPRL